MTAGQASGAVPTGSAPEPLAPAAPATKAARQARLVEILSREDVHSQEQLAGLLARYAGTHVAQATLSRDLDELGVVRLRAADGVLVYALPGEPGGPGSPPGTNFDYPERTGPSAVPPPPPVSGADRDRAAPPRTAPPRTAPPQAASPQAASPRTASPRTASPQAAPSQAAPRRAAQDDAAQDDAAQDDAAQGRAFRLAGRSAPVARGASRRVAAAPPAPGGPGRPAPAPDLPPGPAPDLPPGPAGTVTGAVPARLARYLKELLTSAEASANLVVLRTPAGAAQFLASSIDHAAWPAILGTVAGDDTVLVIARDPSGGDALAAEFRRLADRRR